MTIIITKETTREELEKILRRIKEAVKGVNAMKYCGKVKFPEDGLTLQKRWRDEWE